MKGLGYGVYMGLLWVVKQGVGFSCFFKAVVEGMNWGLGLKAPGCRRLGLVARLPLGCLCSVSLKRLRLFYTSCRAQWRRVYVGKGERSPAIYVLGY